MPCSLKKSARSITAEKLAVVELAQETHPPLVISLNFDPREVRADAGPQRMPYPEEVTPNNVLT